MKIKHLIIITILLVLNGFLNLRVYNLLITVPQIIIVLYLLTQKRTREALFWHTLFFITSYSNIFVDDFLLNNLISNISYNYAHFSFHGLRFSLIITFIIVIVQYSCKKISETTKQTVFYKLYKYLLYCVATGFFFGVLGLFILDYSLSNFLNYGYYALFCYGFVLSFLLEYETQLKDDLYEIVPYIIAIAVFFNFICSIFGLKERMIIIGSSSIGAYCFVLIPLLLFQKKSIPLLAVLGLQLYTMMGHTSGKQIYSLIILFAATLVLSFSQNVRKRIGAGNLAKIWVMFILVVVGYPVLKQTLLSGSEDKEGNFEWKMKSVESLTNFVMGKKAMKDVSASPYIRLAEIRNILYEDIRNPVYLLFGRGFGGYYKDELKLFSGYDLANGAFSIDEIRTGRFSSGHDSFVTIPMLNGLIGFFMMMSLIMAMCKKASHNYLYLTSLTLLLLWFYYDVLMGVTGIVFLFAAEHRSQIT